MTIEARRAYQREYMRELRAWQREHKMCVECGKQDAYTLNGHRTCFECLQKRRERTRAKNGWTRIIAKDDPDYVPPSPPKPRLPPKGHRHEYGLCEICGKPLDGAMLGMTATALERKEAHLCKACYKASCEGLEKGRARRRPTVPVAISDLSTAEQRQAWERYMEKHKDLVKQWEAKNERLA